MENGIKLFKLGAWDGAIAEFEAAYAADNKASPLINLALTYKKLAKPAKALEVLDQALREHRDSMPADQIAAAEREIREMSALLAYVTIKVSPADAELFVDDRKNKDFKSGGVLKLSPGTRRLRVTAAGYATLTKPITVVSGHENALVELVLEPTHAEVIITAQHKNAVIEVNGKEVGRGLWQGMLRPGPVKVIVTRDGEPHRIDISVAAGGRYTVTQSKDGDLESDATEPLATPDNDFKPVLPDILRGIYGLGSASFLTAFASVRDFEDNNDERFGVGVGLNLGYRVADWAGFEAMGQYSDIRVSGDVPFQADDVTFVLRSLRVGLLLRVMYPGRAWIRFVGTLGGGAAIEWLAWRGEPLNHPLFVDQQGVGPFGQIDLGVEAELSNILIDVVIQNSVQGTKHFDLESEANAFDTQPIFVLGPSIRIGYGIW
jgi:hypothetical protein